MHLKPFRLAAIAALALALQGAAVAQQAPPAPALNPQDVIPFDAAVRTTTLPNGLKVFIRHNEQPARRVGRLAVKAGSINEADDQRARASHRAHGVQRQRAHFKAGELIRFQAIGARLGPHVHATRASTKRGMSSCPATSRTSSRRADAMADFAGGLSLDPRKSTRSAASSSRNGAADSARIAHPGQFPVLCYRSRYAERLPIGKPEVIRNAPAARLRAFYDTWYRPEQMALVVVGDIDAQQIEQNVQTLFGPLAARAPKAAEPDRTVPLHQELLINIATDPELTRSNVDLMRKRTREEERQRVEDYRRGLVERLSDYIMGQRFTELSRRPDAKFLGAGSGSSALSRTVESYDFSATVEDGKISDGLAALAVEANRVRQFGFVPGELERAKLWMSAFMEWAFNEREKTESDSYAQEYISYFLDDEPSPGIVYEYR